MSLWFRLKRKDLAAAFMGQMRRKQEGREAEIGTIYRDRHELESIHGKKFLFAFLHSVSKKWATPPIYFHERSEKFSLEMEFILNESFVEMQMERMKKDFMYRDAFLEKQMI